MQGLHLQIDFRTLNYEQLPLSRFTSGTDSVLFKKKKLYFRERGREKKNRETSIGCLLYVPQPGTEPKTQVWALTWNQTGNLSMHRTTLNQQSHCSWATYCSQMLCVHYSQPPSEIVSSSSFHRADINTLPPGSQGYQLQSWDCQLGFKLEHTARQHTFIHKTSNWKTHSLTTAQNLFG